MLKIRDKKDISPLNVAIITCIDDRKLRVDFGKEIIPVR